jgi:hypothetical protein
VVRVDLGTGTTEKSHIIRKDFKEVVQAGMRKWRREEE